MAYQRRVCVIKQLKRGFSADGGAVTGAVYFERLGETLTVTPRIAGLAPVKEGRYALTVGIGEARYTLPLEGDSACVHGAPSLEGGVCVLLSHIRGEAEGVAYGRCGSAPADPTPLLRAVSEQERGSRRRVPNPLPPVQLPAPSPNVPVAPTVPLPDLPKKEEGDVSSPFPYDDEAIAGGDYFAATHEDGGAQGEGAGENGAEAAYDDGAVHAFRAGARTLTYYRSVEARLNKLLMQGEEDGRLKQVFPASRWVKGEGALVGVVYEEGLPRYLCVAAEGELPKAMQGRAAFVPLPFGEGGFWVVFQDADTGEYVRVEEG